MKKKHHSEEQIVAILREADSGRSVEDVCRDHNISKASLHRWGAPKGVRPPQNLMNEQYHQFSCRGLTPLAFLKGGRLE